MAKRSPADPLRFNIYVIELDKVVLEKKRFKAANPEYEDGMPCVYVGMTARTPGQRFQQHKSGIKSGRYVKQHGLKLKPRLYQHHNPMTFDDAKRMEVEKARRLRKRGYGVWQN